MMKRRIFLSLSALCLIAAMLFSCGEETKKKPEDDSTAEVTTERRLTDDELIKKNFRYEKTENGIRVTDCRTLAKEMIIPSEFEETPVTEIADNFFKDVTDTEYLEIPDTVVKIGSGAFSGCTSLKQAVIPQSVREIGSGAFKDTPWLESQSDEFVTVGDGVVIAYNGTSENVTIPGSAKYISDIFKSCKIEIKSITVSEGAETIGEHAFSGLGSLVSCSLPKTLVSIGNNAFSLCSSLEEITVPESVKELGNFVFHQCGSLEKAAVNAECGISEAFFFGCAKLHDVTLSESVTSIGQDAFFGCRSLKELTVPSGVTEISDLAFDDNAKLTLKAEKDSYTEKYCKKSGIAFEAVGK